MYNIRLGDEQDVDDVIEMGRKFYDTMEMAKLIPFDEDSCVAQFFNLLDNGFILIAETEDKEPVGMMGCSFFDWPYNRQFQGCVEHMFWINEEHRGSSIASKFIKEAEAIAIYEGATFCTMAALETSPDKIEAFYNGHGYKRSERAYVKGV